MTQALSIEEAAAEFGQSVTAIEAAARGRKLKGRETPAIPERFEVRHLQVTRDIGMLTVVMNRRELWGDDRLLWALEHSTTADAR